MTGWVAPNSRITMAQAKEILRGMGCASEQPDITTAEEKALGDYVKEKYGSDFVFVTKWPWESRQFYHKKAIDAHGQEISVSADLLTKALLELPTIRESTFLFRGPSCLMP